MNNCLRRNAGLRSFFLLYRTRSKDRKGWRRGSDTLDQKCGQAGSPQINNGSGAFEPLLSRLVLHLSTFNLQLSLMLLQLRTTTYDYQEV